MDRRFRDRQKNRRRRNIKKKNRIKIFRIFLIAAFTFALIFGIYKLATKALPLFFNKAKEKLSQHASELGEAKDRDKQNEEVGKEGTLKEKIAQVKVNKADDFNARINAVISQEKVKKASMAVGLIDPDKNLKYLVNSKEKFRSNLANNLLVPLIYYDLAFDENYDLNKSLTFKEKDEKDREVNKTLTIRKLLTLQLEGNDSYYDILVENLEKDKKLKFESLVKKLYKIDLGEEYLLSIEDNISLLERLMTKKDDTYKYEEIINIMMKAPKYGAGKDQSNTIVLGNLRGNNYTTYIDMGFYMDKHPFAYVIISDYNDAGFNSLILSALYEWNEYNN